MKKGWQTKPLGDLCECFADGDWVESKDQSSDGIRLIQTGNVGDGVFKDRAEKARYISEATFKRLRCTEIFEGDCLISRLPDPVGRSCILPETGERMITAVDCTIVRFHHKHFLPTFFNLYSQSDDYLNTVAKECTGTTRSRISRSNLALTPVPVPPLAEQQRIVGLLDEAFAGIATAKANAAKNLQNARALFESHLQSVFTQRGPGWVEKRLADVADFKNGLNFTRQSKGQTLRMVGVGDFQGHSVVPIETLQSVTIDGKLSDDYLIRRDDILTVRSNGSKDLVGRCMLVPDVDGMTSFSGFIIRIRFDTREISPRFLLHFMKSSATRDRLTREGGGANISNINQTKLSELPVSLPSFKHQEDVANRLDSLREETQRLTSIYQHKLAALEALKKSLLHQAFAGEL
jgi:type I restriction enzyme, S subunit